MTGGAPPREPAARPARATHGRLAGGVRPAPRQDAPLDAEHDVELLVLNQPEHYNWLSGYDPTSVFYHQSLIVPAAPKSH